MWHAIRNVVLGLAAFAVVTAFVRIGQPLPEAEFMRPKFAHWLEHADEFDLVFLGSSRVFRGFDPDVFDAEMARLGKPVHSFNLGFTGLVGFEGDAILDLVLAARPPGLKTLLLEFPDFDPKFSDQIGTFTERNVWWHTPGETAAALESVRISEYPQDVKIELVCDHVVLFFAHLTNYGMGRTRFPAPDTAAARQLLGDVFARRGHRVQDEGDDEEGALGDVLGGHRRRLDPNSHVVEEFVQQNIAGKIPTRESLDSYNIAALRAQIARVEAAGIELRYVTLPNMGKPTIAHYLTAPELGSRLLPLGDPRRYPQLWATRMLHDKFHLSAEGSKAFTIELAKAFSTSRRGGGH